MHSTFFLPSTSFCAQNQVAGLHNIINRPSVAEAVLQTTLLLIHSLINSVSHSFPQNLQDTFISKQYELSTWNFERICTSLQLSNVICPISCVTCHMQFVVLLFLESGGVCWLRAYYQWGLPRLVFVWPEFPLLMKCQCRSWYLGML